MKVFKDIISDDELFSDSYPIQEKNGFFYEVTGKFTTRTMDIDDSMIGGNASAEGGGDEGLESTSESGINIVLNHKLVEVNYDKNQFVAWLKTYSKAIVTKIADQAEADKFKTAMNVWAKDVVKKLKDYSFYTGESLNAEGMIIPVSYSDDGLTVTMTFIKPGLKEVKY
ncbi:hypothetical protein ACOME3_003767 [Neoechinorhynchus agilis]